MPEAVIVADRPLPHRPRLQGLAEGPAARRPGRHDRPRRAGQGARSSTRTDIDDLMLGCGLPGGEQGYNMGRVVAVLLGMDHLPGTTITRYCSSSLQTTRMAFHAIKAGEGDVFISAGVEMVSRFVKGNTDSLPGHPEPACSPTPRPASAKAAEGGAETGTTRARTATLPDVYIAMGQTAENLALLKGVTRAGAGRVRRPRRRTWPRRPSPTASGSARSPRSPRPTAPWSARTTARAPAPRWRRVAGLKPVFRPDGTVTAGNCLPAQRRRRRGGRHERHQGRGAGHHPAGPDRLHRRHRPVAGDHGLRPGRGVASRRCSAPA